MRVYTRGMSGMSGTQKLVLSDEVVRGAVSVIILMRVYAHRMSGMFGTQKLVLSDEVVRGAGSVTVPARCSPTGGMALCRVQTRMTNLWAN